MEPTDAEKERIIKLGNGEVMPASPREDLFVQICKGRAKSNSPDMKAWHSFWKQHCAAKYSTYLDSHPSRSSQQIPTRSLRPPTPAQIQNQIKKLEDIVAGYARSRTQPRLCTEFDKTEGALRRMYRANIELFPKETIVYVDRLKATFAGIRKTTAATNRAVREQKEEHVKKEKNSPRREQGIKSKKKKKKKRRPPRFESVYVVYRGGLPG